MGIRDYLKILIECSNCDTTETISIHDTARPSDRFVGHGWTVSAEGKPLCPDYPNCKNRSIKS